MENGENSEENRTSASYRVNELSIILRERMKAVPKKVKRDKGRDQ